MTSTTTAPLTWDARVEQAKARITDDLTTRTARYVGIVYDTRDSRRPAARSSKVTRFNRIVARTLNTTLFALLAGVMATSVAVADALMAPTGAAQVLLVLVLVLGVDGGAMAGAIWIAERTHDYRYQAWLPLDNDERYRWYMRREAVAALRRSSSAKAASLVADLESMTDAIEELIVERANLKDALETNDRFATVTYLDRDDTQVRLHALDRQLTHVTAVFMAAATMLTTATDTTATSDTAPAVRTTVATVLDGQRQNDLAQLLARIEAQLRD